VQGYQLFTQACGNLPLLEARDAFLANLCDFALSNAFEAGAGGIEGSPRGTVLPPAADKMASPRGSLAGVAAAAAAGEAAEPGLVLAPKNVQSMRTLFNIAHRLSNVLGPAWVLILETLDRLDRLLDSPHTTMQASTVGGRWVLRQSLPPACPPESLLPCLAACLLKHTHVLRAGAA